MGFGRLTQVSLFTPTCGMGDGQSKCFPRSFLGAVGRGITVYWCNGRPREKAASAPDVQTAPGGGLWLQQSLLAASVETTLARLLRLLQSERARNGYVALIRSY